jgi:hypothetical protein
MVADLTNGTISPSDAAREAEGFVNERQNALQTVNALNTPPRFQHVQQLLVQSLQLSIADDQALADWASAKANGSSGQAEFDLANSIGRQASDEKRQFLTAYRPLATRALGAPDTSIPNGF